MKKTIIEHYSEGLNLIQKEKVNKKLNDLIGTCYIYIEEELLLNEKKKIESFLKNLLDIGDNLNLNELPIKIHSDEDCNVSINNYQLSKMITIEVLNTSNVGNNTLHENDIQLLLLKNESDKNYLLKKYAMYFNNNKENNVFVIFDQFIPNLNKLYKKGIFSIPLTYEINEGINNYIKNNYLKVNLNDIMKSFDVYVRNLKSDKSFESDIHGYALLIVDYYEEIKSLINKKYNLYYDINNNNIDGINNYKMVISTNLLSRRLKVNNSVSQHDIENIFYKVKTEFKEQHKLVVADFTVELTRFLHKMVLNLHKIGLPKDALSKHVNFAFNHIYRSRDYLKDMQSYLYVDDLDKSADLKKLHKSVENKVNRTIILNVIDDEIRQYLNDDSYLYSNKLKLSDVIDEIMKKIYLPNILKFEEQYWMKDIDDEIKRLLINIYDSIFEEFKQKNKDIYTQSKFNEIYNDALSRFK
ncbi:hypothetical protein ACYCJX_02235 [Staphylococcus borealis]|uniref:hypothetical protein n=1 Tax=Staphylococcus borealis TaxID=2742203 RepID=UPI0025A11020|nr:hypothetical protein [Staphylococcus borealis]MDM7862362.1 hypothetical protein [Staphylococcus borealis]MDM7881175.1 hypothetical protein [Staphylococcus borealis]